MHNYRNLFEQLSRDYGSQSWCTEYYGGARLCSHVDIGAETRHADYRHAFRRQLRLILPGVKKIHVTSQNGVGTIFSTRGLHAVNQSPSSGLLH
uniref:Transposase n=1 Tax=Ascaris lumbricoides TaxID=6252 RepID=A0A0M3I175_ASCLU